MQLAGEHIVVSDSRMSFEDRAGAVVNILKANAGEALMMARCAGKTRLHNIEPEDLRSINRATGAATGTLQKDPGFDAMPGYVVHAGDIRFALDAGATALPFSDRQSGRDASVVMPTTHCRVRNSAFVASGSRSTQAKAYAASALAMASAWSRSTLAVSRARAALNVLKADAVMALSPGRWRR